MSEPRALPMFPLGTVLFPGGVLPLRVFEPRYQALVAECLAGDRRFGVVLIERGSEVGGGEVRTDLGTEAEIVKALPLDDGHWALLVVGVRRITVSRWLPDEPFPRAEVRFPDDEASAPPGQAEVDAVEPVVRRSLALAAELGEMVAPFDVELADDPLVAHFQLATCAPLGPADRQRLLAAPSPTARLDLLHRLVAEQIELLEHRLASG